MWLSLHLIVTAELNAVCPAGEITPFGISNGRHTSEIEKGSGDIFDLI